MRFKTFVIFQTVIDLVIINTVLAAMALAPQGLSSTIHVVFSFLFITILYLHGVYHRIWYLSGLRDYLVLLSALIVNSLICWIAGYMFWGILISVPTLLVMLSVTGFWAGGWRMLWRVLREKINTSQKDKAGRSALIVGAGGAGTLVARTLLDNRSLLRPKGFVDDNTAKQGMKLLGLPILGTRRDIPELVKRLNIEEIIIAIPSAKGCEIREIIEFSRNTAARLKILPSVFQIIGGKIPEEQIRDIQVEDLLNRKPVLLNTEAVGEYVTGKVILVTGAGGSVGSELCMQLAAFDPGALVLLGRGENSIYEIEAKLAAKYSRLKLYSEIADVRDEARLAVIFARHKPAVVFHAAAHKHVPLMEKSPSEAFKNNVMGTFYTARTALQYQVDTFILISTDKAVNSASVMGATKQLAEKIIREYNGKGKTRYAAVRFGNVLGSRGSVIPLFKKQIASGGPVTITHPEMVRYFMTVSEAAQLVIEAGAIAGGGEIFVLDMGEPVRIMDLALNMIKMSGYRPEKDIPIKFSGIRPGEKLFEELCGQGETLVRTEHEKIFVTSETPVHNDLICTIEQLNNEHICSDTEILKMIKSFVVMHDLQGGKS